jgi:serine/threonine protein kinase
MTSKYNQALPDGHQLLDYSIKKVLKIGGFSYVYIAEDADKNMVAIKEYLPSNLAVRNDGVNLSIANTEAGPSFRHGLKCFFEEGRALSKIDHKNIVRVLNFFRANETVYMVMKYEQGKSLQESILKQNIPVSEGFVRRVFSELLNGLREVHTHKLLHLDIKPSNIYIRQDGSPVLLDFGSARQTLTDIKPHLAISYTPGFASPEQYTDRSLLGPWSDIYSIGATMYACLSRAAPMAANMRMEKDLLVPAAQIGKDIYSSKLLNIIDQCMALNHLERPQSVFNLQKALIADMPVKKTVKKPNLMGKIKNYLMQEL